MTLGKASLCRVLFPKHSAKPPFAECHKPSTRQTIACSLDTQQSMTLCWVPLLLHSANCVGFAECLPSWHSAKPHHRQLAVSVTFFFYRELSQQIKNTQQTRLCSVFGCLVTYAVGGTWQSLCRVHLDLCRNKANPVVSPYVYTLTHVSPRTNTPLVTNHRQTYTRIPITEILLTPS